MRKLPVIFFMLFYCTGTLLFPMGDFSCAKNICGVYDQCRSEDPDINLPDFVFEHLLNLGSILEHFEHDADGEENERPHEPFQQLQSISQTLVIISQPLQFEAESITFSPREKETYSAYADYFIPSDFLTKVFHPPSA